MIGLLPFLFALVIASSAAEASTPPAFAIGALSAFVGASLAAWFGLCFAASRWVGRSREHRLLAHWDTIAQAAALAWFALLCYRWGWASAAPGLTVAVLPFAMMLVVHWWALADAVTGVTGHRWRRSAMVLHHLRLSALPLILVLVVLSDCGDWIMRHIPEASLGGNARLLVELAGMELLMVGTLLFLPPLLVSIWGAQPMPPGPMRDDLARICAEMGVRVRRLMSWPVRGGKMYNAAVVGAVAQLRYVLFTEDLARDLPHDQVRAVLGHELGHVRHGHLWLYLIFANVAMAVSQLLVEDVRLTLELVPGVVSHLPYEARVGAAHVLVLAAMFRLAFGWISRACERQADLAGAELVGDPAIMQEALKSVARLSGQPDTAPNWRHHSIAERVAFLDRARTDPPTIAKHHRRVALMRLSLVFLLAILVALLSFSMFFSPLRRADADPAGAMAELEKDDPDLRTALDAADTGQVTPLVTWLQRQEEPDQFKFATAQLGLLRPKDPAKPDDALLYRYRHRLRALANIALGQAGDLEVANDLAYGLVAGTPMPAKADLEQARDLLPTLEKAMDPDPDPGVLDTIGCVRYRLGDFQQARDRFAKAVELVAARPADPPRGTGWTRKQWAEINAAELRIFRARLAASERSFAAAANGQAPDPLPLEPGVDASAPVTEPAPAPAPEAPLP